MKSALELENLDLTDKIGLTRKTHLDPELGHLDLTDMDIWTDLDKFGLNGK